MKDANTAWEDKISPVFNSDRMLLLADIKNAKTAIGKYNDVLTEITGDSVLKKISRFPGKLSHCAFLAAETLQETF